MDFFRFILSVRTGRSHSLGLRGIRHYFPGSLLYYGKPPNNPLSSHKGFPIDRRAYPLRSNFCRCRSRRHQELSLSCPSSLWTRFERPPNIAPHPPRSRTRPGCCLPVSLWHTHGAAGSVHPWFYDRRWGSWGSRPHPGPWGGCSLSHPRTA